MTRAWAIAALAALAGCTVGPNYRPPEASAPARFGEAVTDTQPAPQFTGWWHQYRDPELDRLVATALRQSPDIAVAVARIQQARAQERIARAAYLPQVNATAGTTYQRFSKNAGLASLASLFGGGAGGGGASGGGAGGSGGASGGSGGGISSPGSSIQTYSAGFDASWELDLFGGVTRQVEGSRARTEAAVWSARDAQLSLVAETADAYLQLRSLQEREAIARSEVSRQQTNLKIAADTSRAGLIAEGDFVRQRAELANAQAAIGPIVAEGKAQMHALAVLTGRTPDALIVELSRPRPALAVPASVPPGLPSELLRRRPDVRAAERNLAAATADIGVAVADLYPRFSLTGMAQLISTALSNLFTGDSLQLTGAANATFPVLDFGRRKGQVAVRRAAADEAYAQYRRTVLMALRDVEDALIRIRTEQDRATVLAAGLTDARRAVGSVEARWRSGLTDFGDVLAARQSVLSAEDQVAESNGNLRRNLLSLYKALGGGWEDLPLTVPAPGNAAQAYTQPKADRK
ncbi:efflux transporter outer membrane subunit [Sphingomonas sp. RHCKR47]|uniref:efflux transporter outer membrane subunit n=1 Tax=Sphingomonas citricola TaxID=2862498 RepID=UPI001CA571F9|nr:efflux transporter outer membrane subunit [Sphingomonas citricola]MBW6524737.1 efflux transporter outer membrane subunit [Sphingomonas citricola]